jgi:putative hydrolase of the HAD superfamily
VIRALLFDFGGVIAEEGFWEGLRAIGKEKGLDPDEFFRTVDALNYETGYLLGKADEASFWNAFREKTGIRECNEKLPRIVSLPLSTILP